MKKNVRTWNYVAFMNFLCYGTCDWQTEFNYSFLDQGMDKPHQLILLFHFLMGLNAPMSAAVTSALPFC